VGDADTVPRYILLVLDKSLSSGGHHRRLQNLRRREIRLRHHKIPNR
jgi:hypothetical protein